jgi:GTP cyclohydrolase IA
MTPLTIEAAPKRVLPPLEAMAEATKTILRAVGEDPDRDGLVRTPERVAKAMAYLTSGQHVSPREILQEAIFEEDYDEMVLVKDIEFYSLCEHHLLPFHGRAHIAYIPSGRIVGLSKLPRLLEAFARRLQVQERLTRQVAEAIDEVLRPRGVAVMLEAEHFCMMMRGVAKQNSKTVTSVMRGEFLDYPAVRDQFLNSVGRDCRR